MKFSAIIAAALLCLNSALGQVLLQKVSGTNVLSAPSQPVVFPPTALRLQDTNASHALILTAGSDLTANRTFTLVTGDANRTLTLSADTTLNGTPLSSVGLTMPNLFSVAGSPLTADGSITVTLATQSANTVLAGPTSGGAATPTMRALVAADIPQLTSPTFTTSATVSNSIAANTSADGLVLTNPTAATSGNQRYSPRVHWTAQGFGSTGSASQTVDAIMDLRTNANGIPTTAPNGTLEIAAQINSGGYGSPFFSMNMQTGRTTLSALTVQGTLIAGSAPTTLTGSNGKILSAALNTVQPAQGGTGVTSLGSGVDVALGINAGSAGGLALIGSPGSFSTLTNTSGRVVKITADTSTSITLDSTHDYLTFSNASPVTANLPALATNLGREYHLKNIGAGAVTVDPNASEQLFTSSAVNTLTLNTGDAKTIVAGATYWIVY